MLKTPAAYTRVLAIALRYRSGHRPWGSRRLGGSCRSGSRPRTGQPGGGGLAGLLGSLFCGLVTGPLGLNRILSQDADRCSVHLQLQLFIHPGKTQGQRLRRLSPKGHLSFGCSNRLSIGLSIGRYVKDPYRHVKRLSTRTLSFSIVYRISPTPPFCVPRP